MLGFALTIGFADFRMGLRNADRKAAAEWLEQLFVTDGEPLRFYKLYQHFTTIRAYLVLSEMEKAGEMLEKLKKLCVEYHRPLDAAEACVLQATLCWMASSQRAAMQLLEEALLAMQPYRVIRIIADEGAAVLPVLKKIAFQTEQPEYSGPLDGLYVNQVLFDTYEVSTHHKGITSNLNEKAVKLSQKHKIILTLLAQGYKSADIVSISGLSINTIKTHTKLMYEKLGVNKAADAVMEAKRRGLIEP